MCVILGRFLEKFYTLMDNLIKYKNFIYNKGGNSLSIFVPEPILFRMFLSNLVMLRKNAEQYEALILPDINLLLAKPLLEEVLIVLF